MRDLYDRLGARDAELLIVRAFELEMARHDRIARLQPDKNNHDHPHTAKYPSV